jgi:formate hydrogenlyase subunit 3/multisubunit Na+/H+ antiporter MnhD subunit
VVNPVLAHSSPWLFTVSLPLLTALLLAVPRLRRRVVAAVPWMAVPALAVALWTEPSIFVDVPWLLLGMRVGLDDTGRVFLLFTAALWIICGQYARAHLAQDRRQHRFMAFFLVSMAGNLGLVLAADAVSFYFFFALMSFASYGLVIHEGGSESRRAGRVYIAFVIAGEILLFAGIVGAAGLAGSANFSSVREALVRSPSGNVMLAFLLVGFGIKTGAVPLHMWLPLAYRAAPIPASAALSGPMIKAGLLGWLRFLPIGEAALPGLGMVCIAAGLSGAFGGVVVGLAQKDPKAALAYSSISQMGLITTGVGVGLLSPESWALILPAIWLYALHHAVAKTALFLGVGIASRVGTRLRERRMVLAGLALSALALAGVPFTSGAAAKVALKKSIESAPMPSGLVELALSIAAVGTTLLMARFLVLVWPQRQSNDGLLAAGILIPWLALLAGVALSAWLLPWTGFQSAALESLAPAYLWTTLWPPAVGIGIAWCVWRVPALSVPASRLHIPAGDLLSPLTWLVDGVRGISRDWERRVSPSAFSTSRLVRPLNGGTLSRHATRLEAGLQRWDVMGVLVLALTATLLALLAR